MPHRDIIPNPKAGLFLCGTLLEVDIAVEKENLLTIIAQHKNTVVRLKRPPKPPTEELS